MQLLRKIGRKVLRAYEMFARRYLYFTPYYNRRTELPSREPEIYSRSGKRMHVFFISSRYDAHDPYCLQCVKSPEYILWDRYNFGLKTHFYGEEEAFFLAGNPDRRFAILGESRAIIPEVYTKFIRNRSYIENEFYFLFTFDEEILSTFKNAKYVPFGSNYWYGMNDNSAISPENYMNKDKNISIIASNKKMCRMHLVRQETAKRCMTEGLADAFGNFLGGAYVPIELPFQRYRYSIVIENNITPYYFTEKITNCFAAQTIPIYLGATEIHQFFNPDGIIIISLKDLDRLDEILKQCTTEEYERRLPAVLDNFERVKQFGNITDYMYIKHLKDIYD